MIIQGVNCGFGLRSVYFNTCPGIYDAGMRAQLTESSCWLLRMSRVVFAACLVQAQQGSGWKILGVALAAL